jgi:sec-independent protein translocase protein TatC
MMALPLMVLYEISIIGARIFGRKPIGTPDDTDETDEEKETPTDD